MKLRLFKSPKSAFCTCPPKYDLNTYTGRCGHSCIYCYAVKFPSFTGSPKPRLKLLDHIEDMAMLTKPKLPVMLSACTDPYQLLESDYKVTRKCVEVLANHGFPLLITTKSDLVTRDIDIFKKTRTAVAITVTTTREDVAQVIEPHAPSPRKRISALEKIADSGLPAIARIDPIIPTLNDSEKDFARLISILKEIGVKHVTVSTLKLVGDFLTQLENQNPKLCKTLKEVYTRGESIMGYKYLPLEISCEMIKKCRTTTLRFGLSFSSCREGLTYFNTSVCDGSAYCR
ncbi:MAG: radical SAM protein [Candidatus Bathyarchaeota archaeon]